MPGVTIYPSNQQPATLDPSVRGLVKGKTEANFLEGIERNKKRGTVLQSSFRQHVPEYLFPDNNGFVHSVMNAYNRHHHLKIRPEDVWLAVLTQLSSYINAHAEELRGSFVAFDGKKELEIEYGGTRFDCDWGSFASRMTHLLHQNVIDPELREWIMPAFSTTTQEDEIVASIVMMASLQKYFEYKFSFACGLPSVTLLGEKSDYELILHRLDKLRSYGEEPTKFADLLTAVLKRFIRSFEKPEDEEIIDFWNRIVSSWQLGSGMDYYSGWITAFMFWDNDGKLLSRSVSKRVERLTLDETKFHVVDMRDVPHGYCTVPIKINDNGHELTAEMMAGSVGCHWTKSSGDVSDDSKGLDTVQPWSGWWIYEEPEGGFKTEY